MNSVLSNIASILNVSSYQMRGITAYVLLLLVSFSFIAEHIPFVKGDIIELVESTEKEKNIKDRKLELDQFLNDPFLELDVTKTRYLDNHIVEILENFNLKSRNRNIDVQLISERGTVLNPESYIEFYKSIPKRA